MTAPSSKLKSEMVISEKNKCEGDLFSLGEVGQGDLGDLQAEMTEKTLPCGT